MSNKKLTFEQAVRSGKDFRCVETSEKFYQEEIKNGQYAVSVEQFLFSYEVIEVKKELKASEIEEAYIEALHEYYEEDSIAEKVGKLMLKKLGF